MLVQQKFSNREQSAAKRTAEFPGGSFEVVVLHTSTKGTLQALKTAADLAQGLRVRIRLLVLQVVPYALPLNEPNVSIEFTQRHFRTMTEGSGIDTHVDIRLGRDWETMLRSALKPGALVVVGELPRSFPGVPWLWFRKESRLGRRLKKLGYQVVDLKKGTDRSVHGHTPSWNQQLAGGDRVVRPLFQSRAE